MKLLIRPGLILCVIGTLVSAQQVSSETVFDRPSGVSLHELTITKAELKQATYHSLRSMPSDTTETYDIELTEEKGSSLFREIAVVAVVVAMVGYMVYVMLDKDELEPVTNGGGKPGPVAQALEFTFPLNP